MPDFLVAIWGFGASALMFGAIWSVMRDFTRRAG